MFRRRRTFEGSKVEQCSVTTEEGERPRAFLDLGGMPSTFKKCTEGRKFLHRYEGFCLDPGPGRVVRRRRALSLTWVGEGTYASNGDRLNNETGLHLL